MRSIYTIFAAFLLASVAGADVTGNKVESFGTRNGKIVFQKWLEEPNALITPELVQLSLQACQRENLATYDHAAFIATEALVQRLEDRFLKGEIDYTNRYQVAMSSMTKILVGIGNIRAGSARDYQTQCQNIFTDNLKEKSGAKKLYPLFEGRMNPQLSEALPETLRMKILSRQKEGLILSPLSWSGLRDQVCQLEGAYSVTSQQDLWKFFSWTRLMSSILPAETYGNVFANVFQQMRDVRSLLYKVDQYSATAGQWSGTSVSAQWDTPNIRLSGVAIGTKAPSFMASFTTPWRDAVQLGLLFQDYPEKPFELVSAQKIMTYLTAKNLNTERDPSFTEQGMKFFADRIKFWMNWKGIGAGVEYGEASALAWLALNAETHIRQNEKLSGYGTVGTPLPTPVFAFGQKGDYEPLLEQVQTLERALAQVGARPAACTNTVKQLVEVVESHLGEQPRVVELPRGTASELSDLHFTPVIADIGMEVDDQKGNRPEGVFRLHLATGKGHQVGFLYGGMQFSVWSPGAMVLHLDKIHTTGQWMTEVNGYDK